MDKNMVMANYTSLILVRIVENSMVVRLKEKEGYTILTEISTLENGETINLMEMENISQGMEPSMKVNGRMIIGMDMGKKFGPMGPVSREITLTTRKMVKGSYNGLMEIVMLENFARIENVVKE